MSRRGAKFLLLVIFMAVAFFAVRALGFADYLDEDVLRGWISAFGIWGPLVYILIYMAGAALLVPGVALTVAGGVLFGPVWGSVYVLFGATAGSTLSFLIARYLGREWVEGLMDRHGRARFRELDESVRRQGWKIVAFTRLIPLFPYNLLNYAYGLTNVKFFHYLAATFVFMIPGVVAYVVFSSSILDVFQGRVSKEFVIGAALIIAVSALPVVYKWFKNRRAGRR